MTIGSKSRRRPVSAAPTPGSRWFQLRMYCRLRRQVVLEEAAVLRVHLPLLRIRLAAQRLLAILAAPAGEEADAGAGRGLVVDDEIRIVAVLARAVGIDECREASSRPASSTSTSWNGLQSPVGGSTGTRTESTGPSNSEIGRSSMRHRVVPLEVGRVRQDQVGERRRLRLEGVADDDERDLVLAVARRLSVSMLADRRRVHRRVPRHVGHEQEQRVDRVRIAAPGVGDDVVHQAMRRQRVFPGEGLVDAHRLAVARRRRDHRGLPASPAARRRAACSA